MSQNKQHHMKVLYSSFPKNGHTAWFDPQSKNLRTTLHHKTNSTTWKYCSVAFQRMDKLQCLIHRVKVANKRQHMIVCSIYFQRNTSHIVELCRSYIYSGCVIFTPIVLLYSSSKQNQDRQKQLASQRLATWQQKDQSELRKVNDQLKALETGAQSAPVDTSNMGAMQVIPCFFFF